MTYERLRDFVQEEFPGAFRNLEVRLQLRFLIEAIEEAEAQTLDDDRDLDPADLPPWEDKE